jgi:hypothetical protein
VKVSFYANGKGLEKQLLDQEGKLVEKFIYFWTLSTPELIRIYFELKNPKTNVDLSVTDSFWLASISDEEIIRILDKRKNDKEAVAFCTEHLPSNPQKTAAHIRDHFLLPMTEMVLHKYYCKYSNHKTFSGELVITSNHLCFDVSLEPKVPNPNSPAYVCLKLVDICVVQKNTMNFFWNGIKIETLQKQTLIFYGMESDRDVVYQEICSQMVAVGNSKFVTDPAHHVIL